MTPRTGQPSCLWWPPWHCPQQVLSLSPTEGAPGEQALQDGEIGATDPFPLPRDRPGAVVEEGLSTLWGLGW